MTSINDNMEATLVHLTKTLDSLVEQNSARESAQYQIRESIAELRGDLRRVLKFIDEEKLVEKVTRLEERHESDHKRIIDLETDFYAIKNKVIWSLIVGIISIVSAVATAALAKIYH